MQRMLPKAIMKRLSRNALWCERLLCIVWEASQIALTEALSSLPRTWLFAFLSFSTVTVNFLFNLIWAK